jgi:medium-chain acyl-[acyl-carrier-protein] hydrolase
LGETPIADMSALIELLARQLYSWLTVPYVLFGYSLGALIAYELAHRLARLATPQPTHLLVAAQRGPSMPYIDQPIFHLPDAEFVSRLQSRYNRIPRQVLEEKELLARYLPLLRADFSLVENYRYRAKERLACPVSVFGGYHDVRVTRPQLDAWSLETSNKCTIHMIPGDHFFIHDCQSELLSLIRQILPA